ncbi:MAG: beta-propeller fold lactonase family protein [Phycisphaerales bacterium]|nr:MAG: beta-propeller fold lactonase family protein [Phycisphaerales bacterium]
MFADVLIGRIPSRALPRMLGLAVLAGLAAAGPAVAQSDSSAVFVVANVSDEVTAFTANEDGTLDFVGNFPAGEGPMAITITPNGRYLAVTHGTGNSIEEQLLIYRVESDASLTQVYDTMVPDSPMAAVWLNNDTLAVTETDVGGANFVHVYRWDPDGVSLTLLDSESTGSFNTHLILHPNSQWLYAQDSWSANSISWFTVESDGTLTPGGIVYTGSVYPLKLAVTHDGQFLYAAGGISQGGHNILGYRVGDGGALTALPGSPFQSPGQSPAHLTIAEDDAYLFAGHGSDGTVRSFSVDAAGALAATGYWYDVGMQGSIGDIKVLKEYLYVTDETTADDGLRGIYGFHIQENGSFIKIGGIIDTFSTRPESIAVWKGCKKGDVNCDGVVDIDDVFEVLANWGACEDCPADVNGDGVVDIDDLFEVLYYWG